MTAALAHSYPLVIQGGMGIGVSNWTLARAVALRGQMGVVSGTCIDSLVIRRLQDGDPGGHMRRAMEAFPMPEVSADVLKQYFLPEGRNGEPYDLLSMWRQTVSKAREQVTMLSSFVEVYLAKQDHDSPIGINLLTKVQMPNLSTLYGAMMAGVDYVLMGAGIPKEIPGALDAFAEGREASIKFDVEGLDRGRREELTFDPVRHWDGDPPALRRPNFLPIVSSHKLAGILARKANGRVDGFVVEAPTAGGHNAPPRGQLEVNQRGEPVYGERDEVDMEAMVDLDLPFWLAGGSGSPEGLEHALEVGAAGIQVGTLFAYAEESGIEAGLKATVLEQARSGEIDVKTDLRASPTGFPFKVVQIEGTNSSRKSYEARQRVCDLGYLRNAYQREDGRINYRCAAEPEKTYVKKGGKMEDTEGRKCLCNALMADIGVGQVRKDGVEERPIITSGDDLAKIDEFAEGKDGYTAADVIDYLLSGVAARGAAGYDRSAGESGGSEGEGEGGARVRSDNVPEPVLTD